MPDDKPETTPTPTAAAKAAEADAKKAAGEEEKLIKAAGDRAHETAIKVGLDEKTAKAARKTGEAEKRGKIEARKMLLARTRKVRLTRDTPTSKGRCCQGMAPRLPHAEADALVRARCAEEIVA